MADPLEGDAWAGLQGVVRLLAWLTAGRKGGHRAARPRKKAGEPAFEREP